MRKTIALSMSALALSALSVSAIAQDEDGTGLTCADIDFNSAVTSRAPDVAQACRDVVELNGAKFAKTKVELLNTRGNRATFRFIYPDGSTGSSHTVEVDSDWRANIAGRDYRMRELSRGQELNIYLPQDRWEAHVGAPTSTFVAYEPAAIYEAEDESSSGMLPATAGALPLFGLFGGIALFGASLIRVFRRS